MVRIGKVIRDRKQTSKCPEQGQCESSGNWEFLLVDIPGYFFWEKGDESILELVVVVVV